jgi:hypothetical protein
MTHPAWIQSPLLWANDRMSLDEFLARWEQMPDLKFAELIDGVVYMPSPVSREHMLLDSRLQSLCGFYCLKTPGTQCGTNGTWLMAASSAPQPDCSINIAPEYGGRSGTKRDYAAGVPEFVAEICRSSRAYDLGPKLALYQSAGVDEYVAILLEERRIEWRVLVDGSYVLMTDDQGVYRSRVLPGLWIDANAFWNDDSAALLQVLERGLASQEHGDFAARLQGARDSAKS